MILYALDRDLLTYLAPEERDKFRQEMPGFAISKNQSLVDSIDEKREFTAGLKKAMDSLMRDYFASAGLKWPEQAGG